MNKVFFALGFLFFAVNISAQKKPLDHSVYDGWKSIGERIISNDGKWIAYTINPQEGDGEMMVQSVENNYKKTVARGYQLTFSNDNKFVFFKIKPLFKDTREAKIKKKKPDDMPKDSIGIIELGKDSVIKIARIKSFKIPEEGSGWMAMHYEKALAEAPKPKPAPDSATQINQLQRLADSLIKISDSIKLKLIEAQQKGIAILQPAKKDIKPATKPAEEPVEEGTELVLRNTVTCEEKKWKLVSDYYFSKKGNSFIVKTTKKNNDTLSKAFILWVDLLTLKTDTIFKKFNDAKNLVLDEEGNQLAFVAERDSSAKSLQKFYRLYHFKKGMDSAIVAAERNTTGVPSNHTVSDNRAPQFSKDGKKLFFGIAPIRPVKDTSLVDFEIAKLDIWNYKDDYLQPKQLVNLQRELNKSYIAVKNENDDKIIMLGDENTESISLIDEGNADFVLGESDKGFRREEQWEGRTRSAYYLVSTKDGSRKKIADSALFNASPSPKGKYIIWYHPVLKNYFTYDIASGETKNISQKINVPLWDDENDMPDYAPPFSAPVWMENDSYVFINDRYDFWKVDPSGKSLPVNITNIGRKDKTVLRYTQLDKDERFLKSGQDFILRAFNRLNKFSGFYKLNLSDAAMPQLITMEPYTINILKAKKAEMFVAQKSNIASSELYASIDLKNYTKLTDVAAQQKDYNWLTVELMKWKMFDGKMSEGLLFKPENFNPNKKYPVIFYFYEKNADLLHMYRAPAPSASTVNIPYFVSNEYIVFDPNIYYKTGQPGEDAYNAVVSAAKYLSKMPWVDSTKMAIQGQSWGGYQVAYLVTRTNIFAAAGAGAPVANMTSAYGGIRWGTGLNRQFQYEHTQSRIGATLWQRQDLYLKNSPLFKADKINTPLLIMHNDADDAVPWYQGIELFTALKRLNKKAWLLQYNGEVHNLMERRNRKDLSIRLGQFFDHYLKGKPMPKWMSQGVPATLKGIDWGLKLEGE